MFSFSISMYLFALACSGNDSQPSTPTVSDPPTQQKSVKKAPEKPAATKPASKPASSGIVLQRLGKVPRLVHEPATKGEKPCSLTFSAKKLKAFSNYRLRKQGAAFSSPLAVFYQQKALQPGTPKEMQKAECAGKYFFAVDEVVVQPSKSAQDADLGQYTLALNPAFPLQQYDKEYWWIFSKNTMRAVVTPKTGLVGKKGQLQIQLRKIGGSEKPPELLVMGQAKAFRWQQETGLFVFDEELELPPKKWEIRISSPSAGPLFLVEKLSVKVAEKELSLLQANAVIAPPKSKKKAPKNSQ